MKGNNNIDSYICLFDNSEISEKNQLKFINSISIE